MSRSALNRITLMAMTGALAVACSSAPATPADLAATLPKEVGGITLTIETQTGEEFVGESDDFRAILAQLGKQPSDLTVATGSGTDVEGGRGVFVYAIRVAGLDANRLVDVFKAQIQRDSPEDVIATETVGGKTTTTVTGDDSKQYLYVRGDVLYFAGGDPDELAVEAVSRFP